MPLLPTKVGENMGPEGATVEHVEADASVEVALIAAKDAINVGYDLKAILQAAIKLLTVETFMECGAQELAAEDAEAMQWVHVRARALQKAIRTIMPKKFRFMRVSVRL